MSNHDPTPTVDWASAYGYLEEQYVLTLTRLAARLADLESRLSSATTAVIRSVDLSVQPPDLLHGVIAADGSALTFAFYVYRDDRLVHKQPYSSSNTLVWTATATGSYRVRGFVTVGAETTPTATMVSKTVPIREVRS